MVLFLILTMTVTACGLAPPQGPVPVIEGRSDGSTDIQQDLPPIKRAPIIESGPIASNTQTTAPNSAVLALLDTAYQQRQQHKYVAAAASLERAIRISPRDATLYLELARVRSEQGNSAQAEQLCKKAVALSNNSAVTQSSCESVLRTK